MVDRASDGPERELPVQRFIREAGVTKTDIPAVVAAFSLVRSRTDSPTGSDGLTPDQRQVVEKIVISVPADVQPSTARSGWVWSHYGGRTLGQLIEEFKS